MSTDRVSVTRTIPAPAQKIFAVLADPSRHSEIDGSGTVSSARGGSRTLRQGDSFGMDMRWGVRYATRNEVVTLEPDRTIAWRTLAPFPLRLLFTGRTWRYDLVPVDDATRVTETWDVSTEAPLGRPAVRRLAGHTRRSMEKTLRRLEAVVTDPA